MGRLLLFVVPVVLAVIALISCISADEDELRGLPKIVWVLVILLFPLVGSIVYFLAGRPRRVPAAGPRPAPPRPVAPDDDPDFLRSLEERRKREDDRPEG